ncbi:MAG: sulfatase-like hydrolase/transferase [Aureibaculum sp.]|nr:sulfatase-like hydrolase/transferase [Aureibaculum sp.]
MFKILFPKRFALLKTFLATYFLFSLIIRVTLYIWSFPKIDFSIINLIKMFLIGFLFDLGSASYIIVIYAVYLLIFPRRYYGSKFDKILTSFVYALALFVLIFSFLSEIPFWNEYQKRFNFIAVDYLLYTYEVIQNIHQSYPLPIIIGSLVLLTYLSILIAKNKNAYSDTFSNNDRFFKKLFPSSFWVIILVIFHFNIKNTHAEIFENRFENEISKSGLYSFFAAYQSNELNYNDFYEINELDISYRNIREMVVTDRDSLTKKTNSLQRFISNEGEEDKPNVILVGLESLNARYLNRFGNTENLTPAIDSLAKESIFFTNLQATGTRTIRGMEAVTLSIPPTPGRSIVKRQNSSNLFTIGEIFKQKGYSRTFFYGGDGYFDNMNIFFGNNGFDIVDRKKKHRFKKEFPTKRTHISDNEVTFENAWATCDADLYKKVLKIADQQYQTGKPFFNFVMTSSNHQPYTYPEGYVDIPSGTSREGAIKYTDWAFKEFIEKAKNKPWFENTVFIIMSDHCAYSAGRSEINVKDYHIPAFIYNLKDVKSTEIDKLSSQIDLFPTLFGYLNWNYESNGFGKDINKMEPQDERAFIANHRKLGLLKGHKLLVLDNNKSHTFYDWNSKTNQLDPIDSDKDFLIETISYYQTAYDLFKNNGLKIDK